MAERSDEIREQLIKYTAIDRRYHERLRTHFTPTEIKVMQHFINGCADSPEVAREMGIGRGAVYHRRRDILKTLENRGEEYISIRRAVALAIFEDHLDTSQLPPLEKHSLSPREAVVLSFWVEGRTRSQIAKALVISPLTVDGFHQKLIQKIHAKNLYQAVAMAAVFLKNASQKSD